MSSSILPIDTISECTTSTNIVKRDSTYTSYKQKRENRTRGYSTGHDLKKDVLKLFPQKYSQGEMLKLIGMLLHDTFVNFEEETDLEKSAASQFLDYIGYKYKLQNNKDASFATRIKQRRKRKSARLSDASLISQHQSSGKSFNTDTLLVHFVGQEVASSITPSVRLNFQVKSQTRLAEEALEEEINRWVDLILQKTPLYGEEEFDGLDTVLLDLEMSNKLPERGDLCEVQSRSIQKLFLEKERLDREKENSQKIVTVAGVSIADMISDIVCIYLYFVSGNPELVHLAWISTGLLSFTFVIMGVTAIMLKAPLFEVILSFCGLGSIADAYHSFTGDDELKGRPVTLATMTVIRRLIEYGFESLPQSIIGTMALHQTLRSDNIANSDYLISVQVFSLLISTLAITHGYSLSAINFDMNKTMRKRYPWSTGYVPSEKMWIRRALVVWSLRSWMWMHALFSCVGLSALFLYGPSALYILLIFCAMGIILAVLSTTCGCYGIYLIKFRETDSSSKVVVKHLLQMFWFLLLITVSFVGVHPCGKMTIVLGGFGFFWCWFQAFALNVVCIYALPVSPMFRQFGYAMLSIYCLSVIIFMISIEPRQRITFWWTNNWTTDVRKKVWNHAIHSSGDWGEPSLLGDLDAHRAMLLTKVEWFRFDENDVEEWINENKSQWETNPPLWFNEDWKMKIHSRAREFLK